jgi:subtilisin family serine protease
MVSAYRKIIAASQIAALTAFLATPALAARPNDPEYGRQANLEAIRMAEAWDFAKGSPTVTVAVLDTGVDLDHPDLKDRIWTNPGEIPGNGLDDDRDGHVDDAHGWDFVGNDADPNPEILPGAPAEGVHHGTLVAGVIGAAGNNGEGLAGVNWNVRIMPLRVLDSAGSGSTASVEAAVRYAVAHKARVINISFTGPSYSQNLANALRAAHAAGVIVVAAAGNEGDTERGGNLNVHPSYPVCYKGANREPIVIGVASLDRQGKRSSFTNYGSDCISLSAPGENVFTSQVHVAGLAGYEEAYGDGWSGSSLAAPVVSGLAALLASLDPSLGPDAVRKILTSQAVNVDALNPGYAGLLGAGRVDAAASLLAVQTALLGGGSVPPPPAAAPVATSPVSGLPEGSLAVSPATNARTSVGVLGKDLRVRTGYDAFARWSAEAGSAAFINLRGDGELTLAVGAPRGEVPYVRLFTEDGALTGQFLAYDAKFRGGVRLTAADIDGDGDEEIVTGAGAGGGPHVRVFERDGRPLHGFFAFDTSDRRGIRVAAFDADLDGKEEILVSSSGPLKAVKAFTVDGLEKWSTEPYESAFAGGVEIATGDLDGDDVKDVVMAPGRGGAPRVSIFDRAGVRRADFNAFDARSRTGVTLAIARIGDRKGNIWAAQASGGGLARLFTSSGVMETQIAPLGTAWRGGLRLAGH